MSNQEGFDKEFGMLRELGEKVFVLRGSTLIVEIVEEEIKTKGGLIVSTPTDHTRKSMQENRLDIGRVLMTGPGYDQEEGNEKIPLEIGPGAIVILPQFSTQFISTFPGISRPTRNKLGMVKMDAILAYYPTEEAYELAKNKLN